MSDFDQQEYDLRFEWGLAGLRALAPVSDLIIIIDVLSFTTCVDIITSRQGWVYPYRGADADLQAFAQERAALVASKKRDHAAAYTLAPTSLREIPLGTRLILPSPNGSTLSTATRDVPTMAGCLRNAAAVAAKANELGQKISVIAAGERWWPADLLRPSLEDLLGAGAILSRLHGNPSPEAKMAIGAFAQAESTLHETLLQCGSGKELVRKGFAEDVAMAAALNVSQAAPLLINGAYRDRGADSEAG